ncbi:hypothetical protein PHMEG_00014031 [Phytophthora megakarya]|uniref:MULE transposase domain-containing protein n=1 Tax=Phytophthora megakarya TaxID=4795 RepID=A0A225W4Y5_9STRA|nr:hypothetical protein PHMEG_00014031 [Phytophthora megakarya]
MKRFNMGEDSMPALAVVQRFVHNHLSVLGAVRLKVRGAGYTGHESETSAFTFAWRCNQDGKPEVGNGTDKDPFVVGITTKNLLRHADRDPASFVLHIDATYKLSQVGYPVVMVGVSDKQGSSTYLLAVFIVSQEKKEQYTELLSLLSRVYQVVTGKKLQVFNVFFHVAKKIYEKTRVLDTNVAAMVMSHLPKLHFTKSEEEYQQVLEHVDEEWAKMDPTSSISITWLNDRVWRWKCYHTPSGFATTNNPCETFNAAVKRDVTLRRKLKVGALIDQLQTLCTSERVRARVFANSANFSDRLCRWARAMIRQGLLYEKSYERTSIAFLLTDAPSELQNDYMRVISVPTTRIFDVLNRRSKEDLPASAQLNVETVGMEYFEMSTCGWELAAWMSRAERLSSIVGRTKESEQNLVKQQDAHDSMGEL